MKTYIVPTRGKLQQWKNLFVEVFREEEHQAPLLLELVSIASWLPADRKHVFNSVDNHRIRFELFEFVDELIETGTLEEGRYESALEQAKEFALFLAGYFVEAGILNDRSYMKFAGTTGTDIVIKILDDGEIDETDERACLSG